MTADLYGHFQPGAGQHHVEDLAAAIEAERGAAEGRVLAPNGTLMAPGGVTVSEDGRLNA